MSNIMTIIYSMIPVVSFATGIFMGFYIRKENEIPTVRKVYRKHKEEVREEEKLEQARIERNELEEYMKAIDNFGV